MIKVFGCYRNSNVVRKESVFSIKQIISNLENITQHEDKKKFNSAWSSNLVKQVTDFAQRQREFFMTKTKLFIDCYVAN